jgi:uncharacterized integral membrane protein
MTDDPDSRDARRARRAGERYPDERRPERPTERRPDERYPGEHRPAERRPDERYPGEPRTGLRRPADPRRAVLAVAAVVVVLGFLVFWIQNHYRVGIAYLTVRLTAPLWLIVTGYFLAGALVGVLLTVYYQRRRP